MLAGQDQKACHEAARALSERAFKAKERLRKRLAALSFSEKIKILEKLRDRDKAISASGLRKGRSNGPRVRQENAVDNSQHRSGK